MQTRVERRNSSSSGLRAEAAAAREEWRPAGLAGGSVGLLWRHEAVQEVRVEGLDGLRHPYSAPDGGWGKEATATVAAVE